MPEPQRASEYVHAAFRDLVGLLKEAEAPAWVLTLVRETEGKHVTALKDKGE